MIMSGGAVARASRILRDKLCRIGAHLLQCDLADVRCGGGAVHGPKGSVTVAEISSTGSVVSSANTLSVDSTVPSTNS
jgi:carbon-monoxide dehydrogenase large subunit